MSLIPSQVGNATRCCPNGFGACACTGTCFTSETVSRVPTPVTSGYMQVGIVPSKKPFKCPICDGLGYKYAALQSTTEPQIKCHACEKGILWG